jgi:hypothetical protein
MNPVVARIWEMTRTTTLGHCIKALMKMLWEGMLVFVTTQIVRDDESPNPQGTIQGQPLGEVTTITSATCPLLL